MATGFSPESPVGPASASRKPKAESPKPSVVPPLERPSEKTRNTPGVLLYEMTNAAAETDQGLLIAYQQGDVGAFETLYDRYAQAVLAYALGMLRDGDAAEEMMQQVFIGFIKRVPALPPNTNVKAYLFTAARNRIINLRRDRERADELARNVSREMLARLRQGQSPAAEPGFSDDSEAEAVRRALNAALAGLSDDEREVVLMRTQGRLSFSEMAFALSLPKGTVATRYRTAITRLREMLNHEHA